MAEYAEQIIKNCNGMNEVREKEKHAREISNRAIARLAKLDQMDRDRAIRKAIEVASTATL